MDEGKIYINLFDQLTNNNRSEIDNRIFKLWGQYFRPIKTQKGRPLRASFLRVSQYEDRSAPNRKSKQVRKKTERFANYEVIRRIHIRYPVVADERMHEGGVKLRFASFFYAKW